MKIITGSILVLSVVFAASGCATGQLAQRVDRLENRVESLNRDQEAIEQRLTDDRPRQQASAPAEVIEMPKKISWTDRKVQRALKKAGYYRGSIDGIMGKGTTRAIREFQNDNGLKVDGIAGENTRAYLREYLLK